MTIYMFITAIGMVIIALYFVWQEDREERKLNDDKQKPKE